MVAIDKKTEDHHSITIHIEGSMNVRINCHGNPPNSFCGILPKNKNVKGQGITKVGTVHPMETMYVYKNLHDTSSSSRYFILDQNGDAKG